MKDRIQDIVDEAMFEHYCKENPKMVTAIRKLIISGESDSKIKNFVKNSANSITITYCVGSMINYIKKSVKN